VFEGVRRDMLMEELGEDTRRIKQVEAALNQEARKHPGVALLRTIPGVGPRTAEAVVAYIDQPMRFDRVREGGSYFGMVPCQDASADKNHLGHITREGPGTVRKLLTEAAWQGIQRCAAIREHYERIVGDDPDRRKIALVATARWLVTVMLSMLKSGEVCRWKRDLAFGRSSSRVEPKSPAKARDSNIHSEKKSREQMRVHTPDPGVRSVTPSLPEGGAGDSQAIRP
jgi:transposase